ncbi:hypothetical protein CTAYLR_006215 [Chrysophaeum taylorii]|uniref:Protein-tyrosine sulfotransferase n=1 Tax=Chrysophaeum taylorii TaxID=2483200 RepID=A0AAD7U6N2_9STRA|nr:hypothetical protein CTAYLR_006215 [Chrysophaeum taylorii]
MVVLWWLVIGVATAMTDFDMLDLELAAPATPDLGLKGVAFRPDSEDISTHIDPDTAPVAAPLDASDARPHEWSNGISFADADAFSLAAPNLGPFADADAFSLAAPQRRAFADTDAFPLAAAEQRPLVHAKWRSFQRALGVPQRRPVQVARIADVVWDARAGLAAVKPSDLRKKALRLAGGKEVYHLPIAEIDRRLQRALDAVLEVDDARLLAGCGPGGKTLRVGVATIASLQRRLVRQLVADLVVTRSRAGSLTKPPLVIVGPPRSGTTLLLELLGADPQWRHLTTTEATCPSTETIALFLASHVWLGSLEYVTRRIKHIHYEAWDGPTECRSALENGVGAPYVLWYLYGATKALDEWTLDESLEDYKFYRRQLERLDDGRAWLLKDPAHCFSLDALFAVFPEATVVWTHRDPRKVVGSWCSLEAHVWATTLKVVDEEEEEEGTTCRWGPQVVDYLARMLETAAAYRNNKTTTKNIVDVEFEDLVADPIAQVERIYGATGRTLGPEALSKMRDYLATNRKNKRSGGHAYGLADFGLSPFDVDAKFKPYTDHKKNMLG